MELFISNGFSQVLGRALDLGGYNFYKDVLTASPTAQTLKLVGSSFFNSEEFNNKNYHPFQKLTALYRYALNREADLGGMWYHSQRLNSGTAFSQVVSEFFNSAEFNANVNLYLKREYDFNSAIAPLKVGIEGEGWRVSNRDELQNLLNLATHFSDPEDRTVWLAQGQTIDVTSQIIIPEGVKLGTWGTPSTSEYLKQVRLVRSSDYVDGPLVIPMGSMQSIWIDGQRNSVNNPNWKSQNINVVTYEGSNIEILDCRSENSLGFTSIAISPGADECSTAYVARNFVDASHSSYSYHWSDGISVSHKNALIEGNVVFNATDVGIVVYVTNLFKGGIQKSIVTSNRIYNLASDSYGGLVLDGVFNTSGRGSEAYEYEAETCSVFSNNYLFTSSDSFMDIGISIGTRSWFGNINGWNIKGGSFINNSSFENSTLRVGTGIVIGGAFDIKLEQVSNFNVSYAPEANRFLPRYKIVAALSAGFASFKEVPLFSYIDLDVKGTILLK